MQEACYCGGMEFSYRITEEDYLFASEIKVKPLTTRRQGWLKGAYQLLVFLFIFLAVALGLFLGEKDASGAQVDPALPLLGRILFASIFPAAAISWFYFIALGTMHSVLTRRRERDARLMHYRSDSSCQGMTTLTITPELVLFRCGPDCITQSGWKSYSEWILSERILLLVTHSRSRRIVNIAALSNTEQQELRAILATALPQKK